MLKVPAGASGQRTSSPTPSSKRVTRTTSSSCFFLSSSTTRKEYVDANNNNKKKTHHHREQQHPRLCRVIKPSSSSSSFSRENNQNAHLRDYLVASAFAGIGGMDRGFQLAGFDVVVQIENDKWCRRVLIPPLYMVFLHAHQKSLHNGANAMECECAQINGESREDTMIQARQMERRTLIFICLQKCATSLKCR